MIFRTHFRHTDPLSTYLNIDTGKITNATTTLQALVTERSKQKSTKLKTTYLGRKWQQLKD
ncbi:hypothetical protein [Ignatzschineria indica]|uniref:hypothetical protein n=1 Tax=Ignatzschineria indica TaxID=472583 RepID=UPI0036330928